MKSISYSYYDASNKYLKNKGIIFFGIWNFSWAIWGPPWVFSWGSFFVCLFLIPPSFSTRRGFCAPLLALWACWWVLVGPWGVVLLPFPGRLSPGVLWGVLMASFSVVGNGSFAASSAGLSRGSAPSVVLSVSWHAPSRSVVVSCSDGCRRVCRVDRLSSVEVGRDLWRALVAARDSGARVSFAAAGNNSHNHWFCMLAVEAA